MFWLEIVFELFLVLLSSKRPILSRNPMWVFVVLNWKRKYGRVMGLFDVK